MDNQLIKWGVLVAVIILALWLMLSTGKNLFAVGLNAVEGGKANQNVLDANGLR